MVFDFTTKSFKPFIERVAQMQRTIGVRWPVVQQVGQSSACRSDPGLLLLSAIGRRYPWLCPALRAGSVPVAAGSAFIGNSVFGNVSVAFNSGTTAMPAPVPLGHMRGAKLVLKIAIKSSVNLLSNKIR